MVEDPDPDYPPPPCQLKGGQRGLQQIFTQSFAYQATWALTQGGKWQREIETENGGGLWRGLWGVKGGKAGGVALPQEGGVPSKFPDLPPFTLSPHNPSCTRPPPPIYLPSIPPQPQPLLLVYISPEDVIELNKAFLRGSCHSCCLWHVKRPATLRALTYAPN